MNCNKLKLSAKDAVLLKEWNDAVNRDYPGEKTINSLFEIQAVKTPDISALAYRGKELTYREVSQRIDQLARFLQKKGVKRGSVVAIATNRSFDMCIDLMGIMKAGGTYVPVDTDLPAQRINYMLETAECGFLLCRENLESKLTDINIEKIVINDEIILQEDPAPLVGCNSPEDLAYILFTSGSTGNPKGAMLEHRSIVNFIWGMLDLYDYSYHPRVTAMASIMFDAFLFDVMATICLGGTCVITDKEEQQDFDQLFPILESCDLVLTTPSRMQAIANSDRGLQALNNMKAITLGGEAMSPGLLKRLKENTKAEVWDSYGLTETAVWNTTANLTHTDKITIGKPVINNPLYVVDEDMNLLPIGELGELCIGGVALARGYVNREDLTAELFIDNPFGEGKIYKTGDLVRWTEDGNIDYVGRKDFQIKIRGFRIELEEIEAAIRGISSVAGAVVNDVETPQGEKALCAYVVAREEVTPDEIRGELSRKLPHYMVPQYFVYLDSIPITINGKADRKALPKPDFSELARNAEFKAPESDIEKEVAAMWEEILEYSPIGVDDDLLELGTNSLHVMQMASYVNDVFQVKLTVGELFTEGNTIGRLSQLIEASLLADVSGDNLSNLMAELEGVSEEELAEMLASARE